MRKASRSFREAWLCLLFSCALTAAANAQDAPAVSIHCRILDDISREPVTRARLTLSGGKLEDPVVSYTGADGACQFDKVQPGHYRLVVEKAGFFSPEPAIDVDANVSSGADLGEILLVKIRSISGAVHWQNGDPAEHIVVHALLVRRGKAAFRPGDSVLVGTDDHGEYRLDRLRPGRYVVYAYTVGLLKQDSKPMVALPVFYPGSDSPDVNSSIDLRNSAEASGISMTLRETSGVRVEGTIVPSAAAPEGTPLMVGLFLHGTPAQPFAGVHPDVGAPFHLNQIPPGLYTLIAISAKNLKARAVEEIEVGPRGVAGLSLAIPDPHPIAGVAEIEEPRSGNSGPPSRVPAPGVRIMAQNQSLGIFGVESASTGADGRFALSPADVGETYDLRIAPPTGTYVSSVGQGGREIPGPYHVIAGSEAVRIVLRKDGGQVSGSVKNAEGDPSSAFIVLAPKDHSAEHRFRTATAGIDGAFAFAAVAPGEYDLFAFDRNDEDWYLEAEYLRRYESKSVAVTVSPGQAQSIGLERIQAAKPQ